MKQERAALILIVIGAIVALTGTSAIAQEKFGDTRVNVTVKSEIIRLDDVEGHVITIFESKGYDLRRGTHVINRGTSDVVKGNGSHRGYTKTFYPDGNVNFGQWEGKVTTAVVDGKPVTTFAGTWTLIKGGGEWANREASGTYRGKGIGEGISLTEWEGEWRLKR